MNYDTVLELARSSRGKDEDGYRSEFIRLVELSQSGLTTRNDQEL